MQFRKTESEKISLSEESDKIRGFVRETAEKIGVSERTIERWIQIGTKISKEVRDMIRGTELARNWRIGRNTEVALSGTSVKHPVELRGGISGNLDNVRKSNLREPLIFLGNLISKFLDFTTRNEPVKTCVSLINIYYISKTQVCSSSFFFGEQRKSKIEQRIR